MESVNEVRYWYSWYSPKEKWQSLTFPQVFAKTTRKFNIVAHEINNIRLQFSASHKTAHRIYLALTQQFQRTDTLSFVQSCDKKSERFSPHFSISFFAFWWTHAKFPIFRVVCMRSHFNIVLKSGRPSVLLLSVWLGCWFRCMFHFTEPTNVETWFKLRFSCSYRSENAK